MILYTGNNEKVSYKPDKPFLLIAKDEIGDVSITWYETEIDLVLAAQDVVHFGGEIILSMEINGRRDIHIEIEE